MAAERRFGPYDLVEQVAVGGMAEIHLAKTGGLAGFEKYVALKMIHPNFSQDRQFIEMLIDEAKISVQLQHTNIAQTFDLGRVGDTYYITMEYVDGCDLYHLLRRASRQDIAVPLDVAAFVAKEVATGLDYAHRKRDHRGAPLGIVHRDVSPQNVLISHAGEVKLVDFGIAKASMRARQTGVGVIKGKYYYMSPEQAWAEEIDHRTDLFSCGILLYEMLQGQMLYLEEDMTRLLGMVRRAEIEPIGARRGDVPPQLERIVHHALAKHRDERYQTGAELASDLERFLHVYSPVFTGARLGRFVRRVLDAEEPPPVARAPRVHAARTAGSITQRIQRDALIHDRSEITDENSVIFRMADLAPPADAPPPALRARPRRSRDETAPTDLPRGLSSRPVPPDDVLDFGGGFDDFGTDRTVIDDAPAGAALEFDEAGAPTAVDERDPGLRAGPRPRSDDEQTLEAPYREDAADAALSARNPRPAVSAVRTPRPSRRTPARGVPAEPLSIGDLVRDAVAAWPGEGGQGWPARDAPPVAGGELSTGARPLAPDDPPGARPLVPDGPAVDADPFGERPATAARLQALDIDELPDAFKLGKRAPPPWLSHALIGGVAAVFVLAVGALFLAGRGGPAEAARIEVVSIPAGAGVSIDGVAQAGRTPMTVPVEAARDYAVEVRADRFATWKRTETVPEQGGLVRVVAALRPITVTLIVRSKPDSAEVFVNGRSMGRTPITLQNLDPLAATNIELRARGYRPERRQLSWGDDTRKELSFELKK